MQACRHGWPAVLAAAETRILRMGIRTSVKIIWALWTTLAIHVDGTRRTMVVNWRRSLLTLWGSRRSKHAVIAEEGPQIGNGSPPL